MFAHILTNVYDNDLVVTRWSKFTGESVDKFTIIRTSLSALDKMQTDSPFKAWELHDILTVGRKVNKLLWIDADINLGSVNDLLRKHIAESTVFITQDSTAKCLFEEVTTHENV